MKKSTKKLIEQSNLPKRGFFGEIIQPEAGDGMTITVYIDSNPPSRPEYPCPSTYTPTKAMHEMDQKISENSNQQ